MPKFFDVGSGLVDLDLQQVHLDGMIRNNTGSDGNLVVQPDSVRNLPVKSIVTTFQMGAGAVVFVGAGVCQIIVPSGSAARTGGAGKLVQLMKVGPNQWLAFGGLG